jgi:hypothetical protein
LLLIAAVHAGHYRLTCSAVQAVQATGFLTLLVSIIVAPDEQVLVKNVAVLEGA